VSDPRWGTSITHKLLSADEIAEGLQSLPDWRYDAPDIKAQFAFANFRDAIAFILQIAIEAEVMNHHPEFTNSWNLVSFAFCTHDVGNKITDTDLVLARRISAAAARFARMG